ncbi:transmembrane protein 107-like [Apostichopus japonicus]|uniref:transmembrane protein 107-like n=1 Tax=Stichopus japonicus TaxID=307972 RepID=UPI003AB27AC2
MAVTSLVPARFLCLMSHLIITITLLWSRDGNVRSCIPENYTQAQYSSVDTGLLIGLILMIVFIMIEVIGFISGVSMFIHPAALISTGAHAGASIALSYFLFEEWPCYLFWWIFSFCSVIPAIVEIVLLISIVGLKKVK